MKHMMKYFCLAVLVLAVATMAGCTKDEIGDTVTFTTTVEMPGGTKALDGNGHKTFAVGDQIKVTYDDGKEAISNELTAADINSSRKSARFTFTLSSPRLTKDSPIKYEYPVAHKDLSGQDGTLATLAAKYDYAKWEGTVATEGQLPNNASLINQYAILKLIIKTSSESDITNEVRQLIVKNGSNSVVVNRTPAAGPIYVAVAPVTTGHIFFEVARGKDFYRKELTDQTLNAGSLYPANVTVSEVHGVLSGLFSIDNSGNMVRFSKGNLYASVTASTNPAWYISTNQYDYIGNAAANTLIDGNGSVSSNGNVDLFGWSTDNYYGIKNSTNNSDYSGDFKDWGTNTILYGSENTYSLSTLTKDEWVYLIGHHNKGMSTINGDKYGIVILPDDWTLPAGCSFTNHPNGGSYDDNTYTLDQWTLMEAAGAIFLPAAGKRNGTTVTFSDGDNEYLGYYWSATANSNSSAYCFSFWNNGFYSGQSDERHFGHSVRLVRRLTTE